MNEHDKSEKSLAEKHALKRLKKVEENQRKKYERKDDDFAWKHLIMGMLFAIILILMFIQMFFK